MISTTFPILILAAAVVGAYEFARSVWHRHRSGQDAFEYGHSGGGRIRTHFR